MRRSAKIGVIQLSTFPPREDLKTAHRIISMVRKNEGLIFYFAGWTRLKPMPIWTRCTWEAKEFHSRKLAKLELVKVLKKTPKEQREFLRVEGYLRLSLTAIQREPKE